MSFFSRFSTPVFKNTGSTARDHLASERTYLAWMRTGLGFLALGIGVERFNQLDLAEILPTKSKRRFHDHQTHNDKSDALVGALLGSGAGSIAYGTTRYFSNMRLLEQGLFKPAFHGAAFLAVGVAGLAGAVYWSTMVVNKSKTLTGIIMATPRTPTRLSWPGQDRKHPLSTGFKRGRRARHLRGIVFWELTDRRHYPRSPRTGRTFFDPVPFPYVPSPKRPGNEDGEAGPMNLDGTNDDEDSTFEDAREDFRERRHENGYPVTSSPTFKKNARTLEDHEKETELAHHLDALDLDADTRKPYHLSAKHIDRKERIRKSRTVRGFKFPQPRFDRIQTNNDVNMYQLSKWAGQDAERKKVATKLLHDRCEDRTEGLHDPFASS
ncbi:hypothetical protein KCU64_g7643, partial [Aureobasidium melanogenum]